MWGRRKGPLEAVKQVLNRHLETPEEADGYVQEEALVMGVCQPRDVSAERTVLEE